MKNKKFMITAVCALAAAFLLGFTGMVTLADAGAGETAEDRLVGMLVTMEYLDLFDFERYFSEHTDTIMNGGMIDENAAAYQNRLYATLVQETYTDEAGQTYTRSEYKFTDVDGIAYFYTEMKDMSGSYTAVFGDEGISDGHNTIDVRDGGTSVTLDGIICIAINGAVTPTLYFNPVYQAPDGRVYATTGNGFSSSGDISEGGVYSQTLNSEYTETKDGVTTADSITVTISVKRVYKPLSVRVIQFDEDNTVLRTEEYEAGKLPETLTLEKGTAYLLAETKKRDANNGILVSRALYERGTESLDALYDRGDGICVKQSAALDWRD